MIICNFKFVALFSKAGAKVRIYFFFAKQDGRNTGQKILQKNTPFPNAAIGIIHNKGIPDDAGSDTFAALSGRSRTGGSVSVLIISFIMDLFLHFASCMNSNAQLIIIACLAAVVAVPVLRWIVKENRKFHIVTWDSTDSNHYLD